MPTIIADAGPLFALIDAADEHHDWAVEVVYPPPRPWVTASPILAEVAHHFANHRRAVSALREQVRVFKIENPDAGDALDLMLKYAPDMDYADACAVLLSREHQGAVVVTTDHADFSIYKVPFISPKGKFY